MNEQMQNIVVVGAGGLGREVLQIVRDISVAGPALHVKGFVDNNPNCLSGYNVNTPILGGDDYLPAPDDAFVIAVGDPAIRRKIAAGLTARGGRFTTLIHPTAVVAPSARLAEGCVVAAFCFVAVDVELGAHTFLNTYASVGHDARVGSCCMLSPYAVVNGNTVLGDGVFLGTHATVTPSGKVLGGAKVAAGSVVYGSIPAGRTAMGNPATLLPVGR